MVRQILPNNNESVIGIFSKTFYSFALDIQRCGGPPMTSQTTPPRQVMDVRFTKGGQLLAVSLITISLLTTTVTAWNPLLYSLFAVWLAESTAVWFFMRKKYC
jgi:hypothetical protein